MTTNQVVISQLRKAISSIPLIDNHAHNILESYNPPAKLTLVSEASGSARDDAVYSLAHIRMLRYLAQFLGLPAESSWEKITESIKEMDYALFCQTLIKSSGIQTILIDDGLPNENCLDIVWHDKLTPYPNKRIVRIEALFESIISQEEDFTSAFTDSIRKLVDDPHVAGFKSIAAYRDGLDIDYIPDDDQEAQDALIQSVEEMKATGEPYRVTKREVIRWLVNKTLSIISGKGKPIQFHTGFGDNDLTLTRSNAALLQTLVRHYPDAYFVLLHSGYPFARQAGYLATVYPNVYLDFGLAIPLLSGDGQRSVLRHLFELCPTNKLLWSSDAAFYPELFYLGAMQSKDAIAEVLADLVSRNEITYDDSIRIVERVLFKNSNQLYGLGLDYKELDSGLEPNTVDLAKNSAPPSLPTLITSLKIQNIKFVRLVWVDYVNLIRYRVIPINHFTSVVGSKLIRSFSSLDSEQLAEGGISIVQAGLGLVTNDGLPPGLSTSGDCDLKPDFSSMWKPTYAPCHAYMMGRFFHKSHDGGAELDICPRTILQRVVERAERQHGAKFLVGFETEFILLHQDGSPASTGAWSTTRKLQCGPVTNCVHEIAQTILDAGIELQLYHAESADGQYEVVTGPMGPIQAADALVATREIIYNVAQKYNLQATLCPRMYSHQAGTAAHVHISIQSAHSNTPSSHPDVPDLPKDLASLMSGVLAHLPTICAFTLPLDASYARVMDGVWSGGAWVNWGRENKEAPLRLCGSGKNFNVELKAFDGLANPYFGLAAVLAGGITGLRDERTLEMRDCRILASQLTEERRKEMHIGTKMPTRSIVFEPETEERSNFLKEWLPDDAWALYKTVRKFERDNLYAEHSRDDYGQKIPKEHFDHKKWSTLFCQKHY
ncbi:glutamine synthetase [Ceratobasidium sp. AG-Ba]|nr:glutamine synthetase [Ceratobasidium sp. AG-Ba]